MKAVVQSAVHRVGVEEWPAPVPAPGEVLVRIRSVTICASDIHMFAEGNVGGVSWDGPFVPCHEAAGVVEDSNGTELKKGTPVVLDPAAPCRCCDMCREGLFHLCRDTKFLDLPPVHGGMRELVAWPADSTFPAPENLDVVEAPLLEPLTVGIHAVELASRLEKATVLIAGCGAIGLCTLQMAKVRGAARVFASDLIPERLAAARELGADGVIEVGRQDPVEEIMKATAGRGVDIAFEAAGPQEAVRQCLDAVRPAGEVVFIGVPSEDEYRLKSSELRRKELTFRFVRRQNENFREAIALVNEGRVRLSPLLTHRFPMERAQEAFELAERRGEGAIRVAVTP
jgi:L-iditol 2-dehydrogenase